MSAPKPKRIPPKELDTMLKRKMSDAFVAEDTRQRRRAKRRSHRNTPRLTAKERANAIVMSELVLGKSKLVGAQIDLLEKWIEEAIQAAVRRAAARRVRRLMNSKEFVAYLKSIGPQPAKRKARR